MNTESGKETPTITYYQRKDILNNTIKKAPIIMVLLFKKDLLGYPINLNLTLEEYHESQKKTPQGKARKHAIQITTAHKRIKAIATLLTPFQSFIFSYIVQEAKRDYQNIFIDIKYKFDPRQIAEKYLEKYKQINPNYKLPTLKPPPTKKKRHKVIKTIDYIFLVVETKQNILKHQN